MQPSDFFLAIVIKGNHTVPLVKIMYIH